MKCRFENLPICFLFFLYPENFGFLILRMFELFTHGLCNFLKKLVCTSNHMFGMVIWDKFSEIARVIYTKNFPNQTWDYWLTTPNQQTVLKLISFNSGQLQNNWQLQNNSVNVLMWVTINRVIKFLTFLSIRNVYKQDISRAHVGKTETLLCEIYGILCSCEVEDNCKFLNLH